MRRRQNILSLISKDKNLTDFERRVYTAVVRIPRGEVRTYGWVAREISRPSAARAVGGALNRNPYAPLVPCHRVIRSDGSLGGFRRGRAAKRRLLKAEGVDWL
jgi:O-6-methylguanine DNA methyltransferase